MSNFDPTISRHQEENVTTMPMPSAWQIAEHSQATAIECHEMANRLRCLLNGTAESLAPSMCPSDGGEMNVKSILMSLDDTLGSLGKILKDMLVEMQR